MKLLIADDDAISLRIAENALRQIGYDVTTAGDGREALGILTHSQHAKPFNPLNITQED